MKLTPAQAFRGLARYCDELAAALEGEGGPSVHRETKPANPQPIAKAERPAPAPAACADVAEITDYERKILTVLAQAGKVQTAAQVGLKGCVSHTSGSFIASLAALRRDGFVRGPSSALAITDDGIAAVGDVPPLPEGEALFAFWCQKMGDYCTKILIVLKNSHRQQRGTTSADDIGAAAKVSSMSGSFIAALAKLRRADLIVGSSSALELSNEMKEAVDIRIGVFDRLSGRTVKVDRNGVAK